MRRPRICFVTGTRAEYGLLKRLMALVRDSATFEIQIIATGMHLSPEFGLTYREIEADGFKINQKVEMILSADTPSAISKSVAVGMIGFADALGLLQPDLLFILGDRYELLSAACSCLFYRIPIAHIHGGETTEGVIDEAIRHALTKMSYLHFVAIEEYRKRVIQLGENPARVFLTGGMGVDQIRHASLMQKHELEKSLGFHFRERNLLVTYHPVTLNKASPKDEFSELLRVLEEYLANGNGVIFTKANADTSGRVINQMIDEFVNLHANCVAFISLGTSRYLSVLQFVDGVVGNSSSGIAEVPSFKKGTINIGDRQKGRLMATSVIQADSSHSSIRSAIDTLYSTEFQETLHSVKNPYGNGGASEKILNLLQEIDFVNLHIKKSFFDVDFNF